MFSMRVAMSKYVMLIVVMPHLIAAQVAAVQASGLELCWPLQSPAVDHAHMYVCTMGQKLVALALGLAA
jgi:hypothetical protein